MKRRLLNRWNILAALLIGAPAVNAFADYIGQEISARSAIKAAMTGVVAAAITYFLDPPRGPPRLRVVGPPLESK